MTLAVDTIGVPLKAREDGVYRVGDSRVSLDVVINEYHRGADAESIARAYPTLKLADVYAVIAYYLLNRTEVDRYLRLREEEADRLRQEIEASQPSKEEFRQRLLARHAKQEEEGAAPCK